jgi:AraC family transcriptional regulator, ethanolamine operon transcriptional activator
MTLIQHYREIVDQFEAVARTHLGMSVRISTLCRSAGINQRTLLRAFRAIHGTTPHRYLHVLRLTAVRQALLSKQSSAQTITQVAMGHGFRELGRFAADYRAMFGESPSDTLRQKSESVAIEIYGGCP